MKVDLSKPERDAIKAVFELGCNCGVITPDDYQRWGAAQKLAPIILAKLAVSDEAQGAH